MFCEEAKFILISGVVDWVLRLNAEIIHKYGCVSNVCIPVFFLHNPGKSVWDKNGEE